MSFTDRIKHAYNAFRNPVNPRNTRDLGVSYSTRPDRTRLNLGSERSIVASIYNRIAMDVAQVNIRHVKVDENGQYEEEVKDSLNYCLSTEANIDQSGRQLIQDIVMSMFDEGCVAVVPVEGEINLKTSAYFQINSMRTAKILEWYPRHIRVRLYNDMTGQYEEVTLPKERVAIIENPLYAVMNEPNSTLQRLIRKINLLDAIDEQSGSGKLDIIIQLPYTIKSEAKMKQAEERRERVEQQLAGSKYGIAYIDATEKVTQLNRPAENNLMNQIEYLTSTLYNQLGLSEEIFKGTADERTRLNYDNGTVEPILTVIVEAFGRKFLTKTARSQGHDIMFFRDPFKLMPVSDIAETADKLTRNEILSPNEVRAIIGYKPDKDPASDQLRNRNLNADSSQVPGNPVLEE